MYYFVHDRHLVMLRRAVWTVTTHTKFLNSALSPVAMSSTCSAQHDVANQRFVIYLENGGFLAQLQDPSFKIKLTCYCTAAFSFGSSPFPLLS